MAPIECVVENLEAFIDMVGDCPYLHCESVSSRDISLEYKLPREVSSIFRTRSPPSHHRIAFPTSSKSYLMLTWCNRLPTSRFLLKKCQQGPLEIIPHPVAPLSA